MLELEAQVAELRYGVLGTLEVRAGGDQITLRSGRQRQILAVLLVHANRYVGPDRLIEACWGDELPRDPDAALRTQVSRLRRTLAAGDRPLISSGSGYVLPVSDGALDAARFVELLETARAVAEPAPEQALASVDEALALWRGNAFADVPECEPVVAEARRLEELRVGAREERAALLLAIGRAPEAVTELRSLVHEEPLRDRAVGLLMEALYRSGRHAEALAAYQEHRHRLAEELGLVPSAALAALEQQILQHEVTSCPGMSAPHPASPVPLPASSFVGRDADVQALSALLERARLVTLVGPGGVGKTRLAHHLAAALSERYPDGVWLCDLSDVVEDEDLVRRLASTLRLEERAGLDSVERTTQFLRPRRAMVVLDNCEQVVGGVAALVARILSETRAVDIIATSRERLAVDGEHLWQVTPLALPPDAPPDAPALQLFFDRARAVHRGFTVTGDNQRLVAEICRRLDGLPLALELAAAQTRAMSLREIAEGLQERFRLLKGGPRTNPRHRSLEAVVEWSYRLLRQEEQGLFASLAVFATGFTMEGATAVAAGEGVNAEDIPELVVGLLDRSLLVQREVGPSTRYGMLETIRQYARERLFDRGRSSDLQRRHAYYLVELAERAAPGLRGADEAFWVNVLSAELSELEVAHRWFVKEGDLDGAARLTAALYWFALWRADSRVLSWAGEVVELAHGSRHSLLPIVHAAAGVAAWQRGDLVAADALVDRGLALAEGPPWGVVQLWECRGDVALFRGDLDAALTAYQTAETLARAEGDEVEVVANLTSEALARLYVSDVDAARELSDRALKMAVSTGNPSMMAIAHYGAGEVRLESEPDAALLLLDRSLELAQQVRARFIFGIAGVSAATLHARRGSRRRAAELYGQLVDHWQRAGVWTQQWTTLRTLVELLTDVGEDRVAAALLGAIEVAETAAPAFGADAQRVEDVTSRLRRSLGEDAFQAQLQFGRKLGDDGAVALAAQTVRRLTGQPSMA